MTKKAVVLSEETRVVNGGDPEAIEKMIGHFSKEIAAGLEDLESPNTDSGISSVCFVVSSILCHIAHIPLQEQCRITVLFEITESCQWVHQYGVHL